MSRIATGFVGLAVAALTLGAAGIEIASGHDLGIFKPTDASLKTNASIAYDVNRTSKADRDAVARIEPDAPTIVFQHPSLPSTTIAAQVRQDVPPAGDGLGKRQQDTKAKKPTKHKIAAACERNVSALSEVAKLMDAGRCIT